MSHHYWSVVLIWIILIHHIISFLKLINDYDLNISAIFNHCQSLLCSYIDSCFCSSKILTFNFFKLCQKVGDSKSRMSWNLFNMERWGILVIKLLDFSWLASTWSKMRQLHWHPLPLVISIFQNLFQVMSVYYSRHVQYFKCTIKPMLGCLPLLCSDIKKIRNDEAMSTKQESINIVKSSLVWKTQHNSRIHARQQLQATKQSYI